MSKVNQTTELGTAPIGHLLLQYALPAIIAMTASSLYNIVDTIYIGHGCGTMALSALTVAKPFMDICAAFGSLVGVGASTVLAITLGQKDYEGANKVLGNVLVLNLLLGSIIMIIGLMWLDPILMAFGASQDTLQYAHDYMEIILFGNILTHIYYGLNNILRSMGHPKIAMTSTIIAVTVNIVLDPIFIFVCGMGVRGAALATVLSQAVAVIWQFTIFCNPHELLHFHRNIWRLDKRITLKALSVGLSPFLTNLAACFVVIIINNQLKRYGGDLAIASFGVINRLTFVFAMIVMGLNQGMQPIVGYNYGAKQYQRMQRAFRLTAICATITTSVVFLLAELCPQLVVRIFTHDMELINGTVVPLRIVCCTWCIVGFQMVAGNLFTSIGMAGKAIFLSLTRQVLYLVPLTLFVPLLFTEDPLLGVWWSQPISDVIAAITAGIMLKIQIGKFKNLVNEQEAYLKTIPPQPD